MHSTTQLSIAKCSGKTYTAPMPTLQQWFASVETDRPFEICKVCEQLLPLAADTWVVNKHYHRKECIMEYAVCEQCRDGISDRFSESSKAAVRDFLEHHIDWEQRFLDWMELEKPEQRLDSCVSCDIPRPLTDGFTLSAQFNNHGEIIESALPFLMCAGCVAQITAALSPQSKQAWQDFIAEHFEGPDSENADFGFF